MKRSLGIVSIAVVAALLGSATADDSKGHISKWGAAPTFKGDGWEFKVGGRVQLDYSIVDADISGADWNAGELRRFRLNVSGKFGDNLKYKAELNTNSSGDVNLEDGYVQWAPTAGGWNVKLGQFKTPNSLDEQTSSRFISTLERAAFTDAFEFNRRLGVSLNTKGSNYTFSAGVFGDNLNDGSQQQGYALAARGTFNPIKTDDVIVHLGASARYRNIGDTQSDLRYRQRPVSHIPSRIISTGRIADSDIFVGAEAAAIVKNFWVAGEYGVTIADCTPAAGCTDDPSLDGAYGEVGIIFGGKRGYKGGKFNRPKVDHPVTDGGMGALALVARYDTIDLNDAGINGGGFDSFIIGVDWWATKYTRLGVNYFNVDADLGTSTSGLDSAFAALVTANAPAEDVEGVMVRAQFDF
jgi:phosphate-selective porin OprO and OprP